MNDDLQNMRNQLCNFCHDMALDMSLSKARRKYWAARESKFRKMSDKKFAAYVKKLDQPNKETTMKRFIVLLTLIVTVLFTTIPAIASQNPGNYDPGVGHEMCPDWKNCYHIGW